MPIELRLFKKSVDGRRTGQIPFNEWVAAVQSIQGVRLSANLCERLENPKTGQVIEIPNRPGDAEVYLPDLGAWRGVFRWRDGVVDFNAAALQHAVVADIVQQLASQLGAAVYGESDLNE